MSVMTYALMAYNQTIHSTTGLTPFEVVFGHTDSTSTFDVEFNKNYTQKLLQDHKTRTKYLYEYLTDKAIAKKERIKEKHGGEKDFNIKEGDTIFIKGVNERRSKDKPRYKRAEVIGDIDRNIVPVKFKGHDTRTPIKDVKRPPQVRAGPDASRGPGPSNSTD